MSFVHRMDISKTSSEELARDLEVALEVMLKPCDPKTFKKTRFCLATFDIRLSRMFSPAHIFTPVSGFRFRLIDSSKPALIVLIH